MSGLGNLAFVLPLVLGLWLAEHLLVGRERRMLAARIPHDPPRRLRPAAAPDPAPPGRPETGRTRGPDSGPSDVRPAA